MSPLTPKTITRIDPAVPLLWRDGETLQIGLEGTLRIPASEPWVELLVARMAAGFRRAAFDVIAHGVGAPHTASRVLLARLEPLLVDDPPAPRPAWVESVEVGDARCDYRMRDALLDEGVPAGERMRAGHVGVILVEGAVTALHLARYLREDITHLPVALERGRTTVGPLIIPGASPCLACLHAHERDRDAAWPRLHAQLIGRAAGPVSAARISEAATIAAGLLTADAEDPVVVEVNGAGRRAVRPARFHAECRCRERSSRSPRGIATAPAPLSPPSATTTEREYARPA